MDTEVLSDLSFTVTGHISRPAADVYDAVADPDQLSRFFTTGGASGRLEAGETVMWDFADFPGAFPVTVLEAEPPNRIVIEWGGAELADETDVSRVTFTFTSIDDGARTRVQIGDGNWQLTPAGATAAFGSCEGWTGMLAALKVWVEHGVNLRDGFYR